MRCDTRVLIVLMHGFFMCQAHWNLYNPSPNEHLPFFFFIFLLWNFNSLTNSLNAIRLTKTQGRSQCRWLPQNTYVLFSAVPRVSWDAAFCAFVVFYVVVVSWLAFASSFFAVSCVFSLKKKRLSFQSSWFETIVFAVKLSVSGSIIRGVGVYI